MQMNSNLNTDSVCDFCLKCKSKYCCSRCHRKYCSADCFKSVEHIQCSEDFFKQCVTEELVSQRFDESSKQKLLEILKRNESLLLDDLIPEEDNEDIGDGSDETEDSFAKRFNDLDLSDWRHLWNKLSDSEKLEFKELLKSGQIGDLVDVWNPWWTSVATTSKNSLITPLEECSSKETTDNKTRLPELSTDITKLNDLISKPTSPSVCPSVVNTLFSYCYVCRLFNGEYDSMESIEIFIKKCPQLSNNINCDDLSQSLEMAIQAIMTEQPSHYAIQVLYDIKCLIDGPKLRLQSNETIEYVLRALSDLISIINKVKKYCPKQKKKDLNLELIVKKLEFYMSWTVVNGTTLLETINIINLIINTMQLSDNSNESHNSGEDLRAKLRPKTLIEEIK